jgi:predicted dehydrogenase
VLLHMVIHHLDTSRYLMGEPTSLYAVNHTFGGNTKGENHVNVVLNYPNALCAIEESWVTPGIETIGFWVEGDKAVVVAENDDLTVHHGDGRTTHTTMQTLYPGYAETHNIDYYSFQSVQRQFTECVLTGRVPATHGRDNLKSLNLVFKAFESTYTNSVVTV